MSFAAPLFLLALVALPLGAWWLARGVQPPTRLWPSLVFWPRDQVAEPVRRRRRLPAYAWFALLSYACAVCALALPQTMTRTHRPVRVYFDCTASMAARDAEGLERSERAYELLRQALLREAPSTPVEVYAWPSNTVLQRARADLGLPSYERFRALHQAAPQAGPARGEFGTDRLWWCGDRRPKELPPQAAFLAVGSPLRRNVGIVAARVDEQGQLWLVIAATGTEAMRVSVIAEPGMTTLDERELASGDSYALHVRLLASMRRLRVIGADGADDLALDDAIELRPAPEPITVSAVDLPAAVRRAFEVDQRLRFIADDHAELHLIGNGDRDATAESFTLRFVAPDDQAAAGILRWEDAERDRIWRQIEPSAIQTAAVEGANVIARSEDGQRVVIARDERELNCGISASTLEKYWSADPALPLLTALMVDEVATCLRTPRIADGLDRSTSPLDLEESRAEVFGVSQAEHAESHRDDEVRPLGTYFIATAALLWLGAIYLRRRQLRT